MAQRTLDVYQALGADQKGQVREWLKSVGGERFLDLDIARLRRSGLRVVPE